MDYRTFVKLNIIGGTIWAFGVTLLGYFLGQVEVIEQNLELAILAVVGDLAACRSPSRSSRPARRSATAWPPTSPTTSSTPTSATWSTRPSPRRQALTRSVHADARMRAQRAQTRQSWLRSLRFLSWALT